MLSVVADIARRHGAAVPQVALAWVLAQPAITVAISGADTFMQLEQNLGVLYSKLETDDLEVTEVYEKSPAAKAGLKVGDVIARLDGKKVGKRKDLADFLQKKKPGDTIGIEVRGDDSEIDVKLGKRPTD